MIPDSALEEVRCRGFVVVERHLAPDEPAPAQDALEEVYPDRRRTTPTPSATTGSSPIRSPG